MELNAALQLGCKAERYARNPTGTEPAPLSNVAAAVPLLSPVVLVNNVDHDGATVRFLFAALPQLKEKEEKRKEEEEKGEEELEKRMVALDRCVLNDLPMTPAEHAAWSQWSATLRASSSHNGSSQENRRASADWTTQRMLTPVQIQTTVKLLLGFLVSSATGTFEGTRAFSMENLLPLLPAGRRQE